ncbi:LysR family transcriptional regulator [Bradyrhizobium genosp. L]|uniref:LysR family transcriptional regulator n=1 Tax=Bradyrhizobium genosp. L TaxID=83637 RepID=UPI0018A2A58C|nr:LysR family transcriptional regulator [Bradyrhizobium genosp. L]QPF87225.1 LysR family transcriptional regulator [Bradyrhizobium genosp. L]
MRTRRPRQFEVSLKHLRAANSVAVYSSFTAAAADLGMTQSAVSRLVLQLERQLGVSLFLRSTRNVILTAPGREFTASSQRLLADLGTQVDNARALGEQIKGRLIISCLLSLTHRVVPEAVLKYRKAHPGVEIHLREGLGSEVYEDVRSGLADFGVGNVTALGPEFVSDDAVQESCFAILPARHPLCKKSTLSLRELRHETFVSLPTGSGLRQQIDSVATANGIVLKHSTVVEQFGTLYDFVGANVGISIVPASALPPRAPRGVVVKKLVSPPLIRRIGILRLKNRPLTPAATGFLDIFRPLFLSASRR